MLKFLVGLSLAALISGNVVDPQNHVDPQQPTNCDNTEVLLKVWTILSNLLPPEGKSIKVPDVDQIKYALTLIKKSLEKHPAQNNEPSKKLHNFENELAKKTDVTSNDTRPLRSLLQAIPVKTDPSSNMLFRYDLPSNIRPKCKAAFLNLINVAQEAYVNMAKSPICNDAYAEPLVPEINGLPSYVPNQSQRPYNPVLINPSEEALKKVTEYLKAPEKFNSNVISLLESLQNKNPYVSPLYYEPNRYPQTQINSNTLNNDQNHEPNNVPGINSNDNINAVNYYPPIQGSFNINLEHAKDIANKLIAENQYKPDIQDANIRPDKPMSEDELQKLLYKHVESENNENVQNYKNRQQPQNKVNQPTVYYYPNPYQNPANVDVRQPNNVGDNDNYSNKFYEGGYNNPGTINHIIYQNKSPNKLIPTAIPWPYNSNNNPVLHEKANDANSITNSAKLETNIRPKGQVELTYLLKRKRPLIYQPFYFVKYRLPYNSFVQNLKQMLSLEPDLSTPPTELYKGLISPSNTTEVSPDLASYPKEEIHNLVLKDGALVKAKYIEPNETENNDKTRDTNRDPGEVYLAGGDIVEQKFGSGLNNDGFNFNQNEYRPVGNPVGLNLQNPVANQAMLNQETRYHKRIPLYQETLSLEKYLASLGLDKNIAKDQNLAGTSQVNPLYKVENHQYRPETSKNLGNQYAYLGNQHSILNQLYSPNTEHSAPSSIFQPPYLTNNQALLKNPYAPGNQATLSQNYRPYVQSHQFGQESPLSKLGYQFVRPSYAVGVESQPTLSQVGPVLSPYILGTQAAMRLNNKFQGNSLISNNLHALRRSRRLLGGFLNPIQYGYNRPGLNPNPNGLGSPYPYPGVLGNQGVIGQPGYVNNFGNGIRQTYLYKQPPLYG